MTAGSDADGRPVVVPDPEATRPGRGAHLHPTTACYDLAVRRRAFDRALRATSPLDGVPLGSYLGSLASKDRGEDRGTDRLSDQELEQ